MSGVCFHVNGVYVDLSVRQEAVASRFGPLSGQVISCIKDACKRAFLKRSPRLVQPLYHCSVQVFGSDHLGRAYAVLSKRRAQPHKEDWKEGSDLYEIFAYMPVAESFGFAEELFKVRGGV